jgi:uncharacterized protein with NAD-binding domain and iron-sulfur cluster
LRWTMRTPRPNVHLAGAWTASDWPATMEAAVRSGSAAAEAVMSRRLDGGDPGAEGLALPAPEREDA